MGHQQSVWTLIHKSHGIHIPKQVGGQDCGVFAIAIATALAYGLNAATLKFNQVAM